MTREQIIGGLTDALHPQNQVEKDFSEYEAEQNKKIREDTIKDFAKWYNALGFCIPEFEDFILHLDQGMTVDEYIELMEYWQSGINDDSTALPI